MAKEQGDAYPDPRRIRSGKFKIKVLVCIGLLLICLGSFISAVSAPSGQPDPRCAPDPIFMEHSDGNLSIGNHAIGIQTTFIAE